MDHSLTSCVVVSSHSISQGSSWNWTVKMGTLLMACSLRLHSLVTCRLGTSVSSAKVSLGSVSVWPASYSSCQLIRSYSSTSTCASSWLQPSPANHWSAPLPLTLPLLRALLVSIISKFNKAWRLLFLQGMGGTNWTNLAPLAASKGTQCPSTTSTASCFALR